MKSTNVYEHGPLQKREKICATKFHVPIFYNTYLKMWNRNLGNMK
jgi:hypothetical protein